MAYRFLSKRGYSGHQGGTTPVYHRVSPSLTALPGSAA
ncbi:hypothetical protein FHS98_003439 [Sphingomonas oligoaromativorans]|nr:hypothetical protein [Sphingomonas oligoaromativorans]